MCRADLPTDAERITDVAVKIVDHILLNVKAKGQGRAYMTAKQKAYERQSFITKAVREIYTLKMNR